MKKYMFNLLLIATLTFGICNSSYATHDNGQGKSQDPSHEPDLSSISVAPEPSSFWLFLTGFLMVAGYTYTSRRGGAARSEPGSMGRA